MTTALGRAIDALSDPDVALADALRRLKVVSRRIGSSDLTSWITNELDGFDQDADLPRYRNDLGLPIQLLFAGPLQSQVTRTISQHDLPDELPVGPLCSELRQPVAELEAFVASETEVSRPLPTFWLGLYRELASEGKVPTMNMMLLNHAAVRLPRTALSGILDRIKSTALDLALDIEEVAIEAGDPRGPTVANDDALARTVSGGMTTIYAHNSTITLAGQDANVASGDGAFVDASVKINDVNRVLATAREYLTDDGVAELADAIEQDGGAVGQNTRSFMERVKSGGAGVAQGVVGNVAFTGIMTSLGLG